jgi:hypothetical protein
VKVGCGHALLLTLRINEGILNLPPFALRLLNRVDAQGGIQLRNPIEVLDLILETGLDICKLELVDMMIMDVFF